MLEAISGASWANIWAGVSAVSTALTVLFAGVALVRWKKQDQLKVKLAFKTLVCEYADILSTMPQSLELAEVRQNNQEKRIELTNKLVAMGHAYLVCEGLLSKHKGVADSWDIIATKHLSYVKGATPNKEIADACHKIMKARFVFK